MDVFKHPKPVVVISMDGVGVAPPGPGNAVTLAKTPNLDKYWPQYPHTFLQAAGVSVGLPEGVDGNSEVGHLSLGAGKVIYQDLPRIDRAIDDGSFQHNPILLGAIEHVQKHNSALHIMGLVGEGKVHSSMEHLYALLKLVKEQKIDPDKVYIHAFSDGRDSPPRSAVKALEDLEARCLQLRVGRIVSLTGRYYAMDRDRRWDKTKLAYDTLTIGAPKVVTDYHKGVEEEYKAEDKDDQYLKGFSLVLPGEDPITVSDNDALIFFNFRPDRATQLSMAFEDEKFDGFEKQPIKNLYYCGMAEYDAGFPRRPAFPKEKVENSLGKVLSDNRMRQLRIAESEKYPHVTYFFNGGVKRQHPGEDWVEVPSPKEVATYDEKPEMSSYEINKVLLEKLEKNTYDFVLVNYASADMVAHTGVLDATVKAMEVVDECVGQVVDKVLQLGGVVLITADHGNAEELLEITTSNTDTKHSTNPVPLVIIGNGYEPRELTVGVLADVAPTVLGIMGIEKPADMTGRDMLD